jgi:hypothetical protein
MDSENINQETILNEIIDHLNNELKYCTRGDHNKPISEFNKNQTWCKACQKQYREDNKEKIAKQKRGKVLQNKLQDHSNRLPTDTKRCYDCTKVKLVGEFYTNTCLSDGLCSQCIECQLEAGEKARKKAHEELLATSTDMRTKVCDFCDEERRILEFNTGRAGEERQSTCRKCCDFKQTLNDPETVIKNQEKICYDCVQMLPFSAYHDNVNKPFGKQLYCIPCFEIRTFDDREKKKAETARLRAEFLARIPEYKICLNCTESVHNTHFTYNRVNLVDGLADFCDFCKRQIWREENKESIKQKKHERYKEVKAMEKPVYSDIDIKECSSCTLFKLCNFEFYEHPAALSGLTSQCIECITKDRQTRYEFNKTKDWSHRLPTEPRICKDCDKSKTVADFNISYHYSDCLDPTCRECSAKQYEEWYEANKEEILARQKERRITDPIYRVDRLILSAINVDMQGKKNGISKKYFLPFPVQDVKNHIEKQFTEHMNSWDKLGNYRIDTWRDDDPETHTFQIDHIVPRFMLQYDAMSDDNFKKCWHPENLRPYPAKQNVQDCKKRFYIIQDDLKAILPDQIISIGDTVIVRSHSSDNSGILQADSPRDPIIQLAIFNDPNSTGKEKNDIYIGDELKILEIYHLTNHKYSDQYRLFKVEDKNGNRYIISSRYIDTK